MLVKMRFFSRLLELRDEVRAADPNTKKGDPAQRRRLRQLLDPDSSSFASLFTWRVADDAKQRPHPATHGILTRLKAGETIPDASWRQDTVC